MSSAASGKSSDDGFGRACLLIGVAGGLIGYGVTGMLAGAALGTGIGLIALPAFIIICAIL